MKERLSYLLQQVKSGRATTEEYDELLHLIRSDETGEALRALDIFHAGTVATGVDATNQAPVDSSWEAVLQKIMTVDKDIDISARHTPNIPYTRPEPSSTNRHILLPRWMAAAAVLLLLAGTTTYYIFHANDKEQNKSIPVKQIAFDAPPGTKKATLTLANGQQILLDNATPGLLTQQGNSRIVKLNGGRITYEQGATGAAAPGFNVLTTPRGGQYQVILPDGTRVWLNAASSLKYPAAFTDGQRRVELSGEAYFEVTKNKTMPFRVIAGNQTVEVLGTHFNINAYSDEPSVKTSLLEGSVKVSRDGTLPSPHHPSAILHPGEQSIIATADSSIHVARTDLAESIAWKNGDFSFQNADIRSVMRKIQRWYDVDIKFEDKTSNFYFSGSTVMNKNLSEVLKVLELSGVHFRVEGKTLVVYP